MKTSGVVPTILKLFFAGFLLSAWTTSLAQSDLGGKLKALDNRVLYIWAQDEAHVAPDFLAVIDFGERSNKYGQVINVVPLPPPGNFGNEPHQCHLNSTRTILGCGGLPSSLKNQNRIFFFDVTNAKQAHLMFSAARPTTFCPLKMAVF
jgi:hypothetical protein